MVESDMMKKLLSKLKSSIVKNYPYLILIVAIYLVFAGDINHYLLYYSPFARFFYNHTPSEKYCSLNNGLSETQDDSVDPEIEFKNIQPWMNLKQNSKIIIEVRDDSPIDWSTFKFFPDTDWKNGYFTVKPYKIPRKITDDKIELSSNGPTHTITYTPQKPFIYGWSYYFNAEICDCNSNCSHKTIFTTVCTTVWCFFHSIPSYLLALFLWWHAIFAPKLVQKRWGTVYDSVTKEPISNAIVRLYSIQERQLITTKVSGLNGSFILNPPKGKYKISVTKNGYVFPSKLKPLKVDGDRINLYYGEIIQQKREKILELNIPLDSKKKQISSFVTKAKNRFLNAIAYTSPILLVLGGIIPVFMWGLQYFSAFTSTVFLGLFLTQQYIRLKERDKYGLVTDESGNPLRDIEIGLYDYEFDKLVTTTKTDSEGKYIFIVPGNKYKLKVHSSEYTLLNDQKKNQLGDLIVEKNENSTISIGKNFILTSSKSNQP